MYSKHGVDKTTALIERAMSGIRELGSDELGSFFDNLYLEFDGEFEEYCFILDEATAELEQGMTEEEIKAQDQKMQSSHRKIKRLASAHEIGLSAYFKQQEETNSEKNMKFG